MKITINNRVDFLNSQNKGDLVSKINLLLQNYYEHVTIIAVDVHADFKDNGDFEFNIVERDG